MMAETAQTEQKLGIETLKTNTNQRIALLLQALHNFMAKSHPPSAKVRKMLEM